MRAGIGIFVVVLLLGAVFFFLTAREQPSTPLLQKPMSAVEIIAENLEIPWDLAFLPEGSMLVTQRGGELLYLDPQGNRSEIVIEGVAHRGEGGLLGIALHPRFLENRLLYLYLTTPASNGQSNRVERYHFENSTLSERTVIIADIPGAPYHDGGRIDFGPDGLLYITTGDAGISARAQDKDSLAGKILRLRDDGTLPQNPFGTAVYSWGHRNPQGIAWDSAGRLFSTEHGRSGLLSGYDEINLIEEGGNYGWPELEGDEGATGMIGPLLHSGSDSTWAPASVAILEKRLYFGGLRGEALYEATLDEARVTSLRELFKNQFGRIRTVRVGPDGMLYLTTSNRDGRGTPSEGDDKLLRIDPKSL